MKALSILLSSILIVLLATQVTAATRKWTDNTGKFSVEAELVEAKDGKVTLKRADGSTVMVALERLSEADREYIASHGGPAFTKADPKEELKRWQGLWIQAFSIKDGWTTSIQGISVGIQVEGDKLTHVRVIGADVEKYETDAFVLNPAKSPKEIDITMTKDDKKSVQLGIYEFKDGLLLVSLGEPDSKVRPKSFEDKKARITGYQK